MNFANTWLELVVVAFAAVAGLGALVAVARASFAKAQIEGLRGDRDDLTERVRIVENEKARDKLVFEKQLAQLRTELDAEHQKVEVLERIVTGKELLERLANDLTNTAAKANDQHQKILEAVKAVHGLLGARS